MATGIRGARHSPRAGRRRGAPALAPRRVRRACPAPSAPPPRYNPLASLPPSPGRPPTTTTLVSSISRGRVSPAKAGACLLAPWEIAWKRRAVRL